MKAPENIQKYFRYAYDTDVANANGLEFFIFPFILVQIAPKQMYHQDLWNEYYRFLALVREKIGPITVYDFILTYIKHQDREWLL